MTNPTAAPMIHEEPSSPSFSSFPDQIVTHCLARISRSHYHSLCLVSKRFYSLLSSPGIYETRSQIQATEPRLYLCLRLPRATGRRWFTLRNPDQTLISSGAFRNRGQTIISNGGETKSELSLVPVKLSSSYPSVRLNAAIVAVGSEIYEIGGSNEDKRSTGVRVLDCRSHTRRLAPNMRVARRRPKACVLDGKIYVMGGCSKREEPNSWGEVFDLKTQTWKEEPLPSPSGDEFDGNHKVVVFGARLYVITKRNKYAYDPTQERWVGEMALVGLERIVTSGAWCVIENLVLSEYCGKLWWCDISCGKWVMLEGLRDLYRQRAYDYRTIQLVNYGGKLMIVWQEWTEFVLRTNNGLERPLDFLENRNWCALIRLEKRLTSSGSEIWGEIDSFNSFLSNPNKLLSCLSVSL